MGLRGTVSNGVQAAFKAISDLARSATYQSHTGVITRDIAAGTSVAQVVPYTLKRVVFTKFKDTEIDNEAVLVTDQKMLFPAADLPVDPKASDTIIDFRGRTWEIIKRLDDPASALIIVQVRSSR